MATKNGFLCGISLFCFSLNTPITPAAEPRELRIYAQQGLNKDNGSLGPVKPQMREVFRSAQELAANVNRAKANDPGFQKEVEASVASALKVKSIDWSKQMVVAARIPTLPTRGGLAPVEFTALKVSGDQLTVSYELRGQKSGCCPSPIGFALVERFNGSVVFEGSKGNMGMGRPLVNKGPTQPTQPSQASRRICGGGAPSTPEN